MKALVCRGPRDVRVEDVPDPKIEWPTDGIARVTSTNICGSDLHMYEGRTDLEAGQVIGHENLGEVIEVGPAVRRIKMARVLREGAAGRHPAVRREDVPPAAPRSHPSRQGCALAHSFA